jgi:hypothetical protein
MYLPPSLVPLFFLIFAPFFTIWFLYLFIVIHFLIPTFFPLFLFVFTLFLYPSFVSFFLPSFSPLAFPIFAFVYNPFWIFFKIDGLFIFPFVKCCEVLALFNVMSLLSVDLFNCFIFELPF